MLEALAASPFLRIRSCFAVVFLAVTRPYFFADELAAPKVSAVVAVSVYRLAFESLRLLASRLAVFVAHELRPLPV
jgi:hypothetical protein